MNSHLKTSLLYKNFKDIATKSLNITELKKKKKSRTIVLYTITLRDANTIVSEISLSFLDSLRPIQEERVLHEPKQR